MTIWHHEFIALLLLALVSDCNSTLNQSERWLDDGLVPSPSMGWNSYNQYSCQPNESIITPNAEALVDLGLADLGYKYVTTDCGWSLPESSQVSTILDTLEMTASAALYRRFQPTLTLRYLNARGFLHQPILAKYFEMAYASVPDPAEASLLTKLEPPNL